MRTLWQFNERQPAFIFYGNPDKTDTASNGQVERNSEIATDACSTVSQI